mmetsp:Transcript_31444/g.65139  ORF Transcript_31444/g.65139 Transcript_31444/m.65139 type:complete len:504 (+) Transcript_31444:71-1582(+)|eukprot:CAMPEP_0181312106 /NCGR_PEP_ID=MMETSP1101-20121128/13511_1 /TAXON_ID=46948 /ORGANISM="Rhodomonas abbreviata, Strain Caron Lab Isolate" /LENGTH=503 /DNA_ID=CAMNT_0023418917 /DNA_START=63 /DNA_END=1574 /DNA_ORIENTATION=-
MTAKVYQSAALVIEDNAMLMTNSQKEREEEIFGPFKGVALSGMPDPEALWGIIQEHSGARSGGKVDTVIFGQFCHWLAVQSVSKLYAQEFYTSMLDGAISGMRGSELTFEQVFELQMRVIDIVVPTLAPDLFRVIDHNSDGEISKDEWMQGMGIVTNWMAGTFDPEQAFTLVFTIIDKNGNGKLETSELVEFANKMIHLAANLIKAVMDVGSRTALECKEHETVDQVFAALDQDKDSMLSFQEVTANAKPEMVAMMQQQMKTVVEAPTPSLETEAAKVWFQILQEISVFEDVKKEAFKELVKNLMADKCSAFLAFLKTDPKVKKMEEEGTAKLEDVEKLLNKFKEGGFDTDLRALSEALFDVLDADDDGKLSSLDITCYTDFLFKDATDLTSEGLEERMRPVFDRLDKGKTGLISKDELFAYLQKWGRVGVTAMLLWMEVTVEGLGAGLERLVRTCVQTYLKHLAESGGSEVPDGMDAGQFAQMFMSAPAWGQKLTLPGMPGK